MKNTFASLFIAFAVALPATTALAMAPEQASEPDRTAGLSAMESSAAVPMPEAIAGFSEKERQAIYDYFDLPPFQRDIREDIRARIHDGPDALVNSRLSVNVPRNDLPVRLERKLNPPKIGTKNVAIDADLVMLDLDSQRIVDVVPNVIPQYTK